MRWLLVLIVIALAVWLWRRTRRAPLDGDRELRDLRASSEARRRLDDQRSREDRGGVGGWSL
ncbi:MULTISPECIES: hypothetical protein [Micromonospora]|uniref:Uncharacterized protein n=1 Tax=Micromonospora solifontis TaxID=2487138 RepID=A0ABX9WCW4_9ACTN|nr:MULTISPECIES: hypothetical protein [Micromonospora]NES15192.1 protein BatD [Micromonospora sp. PPF5-17B]NES38142.1 protein BatD [Micromonospora solifontis]NES56527.1 protein BatD [Micromonospora sp. PPF5-6]RNL96999.1 hypothetical protein EFE23_18590 [Micromonospora solifontis]